MKAQGENIQQRVRELEKRLQYEELRYNILDTQYNAVVNSLSWRLVRSLCAKFERWRIFSALIRKAYRWHQRGKDGQGVRSELERLAVPAPEELRVQRDGLGGSFSFVILLTSSIDERAGDMTRKVQRSLDSIAAQVLAPVLVCVPQASMLDSCQISSRFSVTVGIEAWEAGLQDAICIAVPAPEGGGGCEAPLHALRGVLDQGLSSGFLGERAYVCVLEVGDTLHPQALLRFGQALESYPGARLLYADEEVCSGGEERSEQVRKSGWNPELLSCMDYIHCPYLLCSSVLRLVLDRAGPPDGGSWPLLLAAADHLDFDQVVHVPEILATTEKLPVAIREFTPGHLEIEGSDRPLVSIIIPTWNHHRDLVACVDSVFDKTVFEDFEVVLMDNNTDEPRALEALRVFARRERVRVVSHPEPFNYSAINNRAAKLATGQVLVLLNNDVVVDSPDWLGVLVGLALQPHAGCVGALLKYPDETVQHAGIVLGLGGVAGHGHRFLSADAPGYCNRLKCTQAVSAVTGACLAVRREIYELVGGLDERLAVEYNDVDFCIRVMMAGYRNIWTPKARLYHLESASRKVHTTPESMARHLYEAGYMRAQWGHILADDYFYNPALTSIYEDFSLAERPRHANPRLAPWVDVN